MEKPPRCLKLEEYLNLGLVYLLKSSPQVNMRGHNGEEPTLPDRIGHRLLASTEIVHLVEYHRNLAALID